MPQERFVKGVGSFIRQRAMPILRDDRGIHNLGDSIYAVPSQSSAELFRVGLASDPLEKQWQRGGFTPDFCACPYHKRATNEDGDGLVCSTSSRCACTSAGCTRRRGEGLDEPCKRYKNPPQYDTVKTKEKGGVRQLIRATAADLFPSPADVIPGIAREGDRAA